MPCRQAGEVRKNVTTAIEHIPPELFLGMAAAACAVIYRLLWRVFDNLLSNVCKYGLADTRLYADAAEQDGNVTVTFRNIPADRLNIPVEELMERFVCGDSSRTTGGCGPGPTIARSLTELQNSKFNLEIEGDMFNAFVVLPAAESVSEE